MTGDVNFMAMGMFLLFVGFTLVITFWAARRSQTTDDFYAAGSRFGGAANGLAISGDFMSAATFLGISALVFSQGFDGMLYSVGGMIGWPVVLFLIADRLRNLGRYTFADIAAYRLDRTTMRGLAAVGSLAVIIPYLIAQMVGAGALIEVLFGLPYMVAVVIVGVLMALYVSVGGMLATTWVQIVKAALLLVGGVVLTLLVLALFDFDFEKLLAAAVAAHPEGERIVGPLRLIEDPITAISLGLAFLFGPAGLPHILMRFFTVPNAREARRSVLYATGIIAFFQLIVFVIGLGAMAILSSRPEFFSEAGGLRGGVNMASIHLASAIGGNAFLGFVSAVAFATILAVVAGLTLAAASAISHDLYAEIFRHGRAREKDVLRLARITPIVVSIIAVVLGIAFQGQNVAYLGLLALAIAASVNFPILVLAMFWRNFTSRGALWGGIAGLVTAVVLEVLSPAVWVAVLGNEKAPYPYDYPTLFSMTAAFLGAWLGSVTDRGIRAEAERASFDALEVQALLGRRGDA